MDIRNCSPLEVEFQIKSYFSTIGMHLISYGFGTTVLGTRLDCLKNTQNLKSHAPHQG